ncbi:Rpm1 interacting protein [Thalictrum thalictroides]|uniref:Rpm1 interacting protein n=1 Tax=Thalictrum thalictroides TaxID=46969 RepID=A0A7J6V3W1_THATH|nr:Rpm1 interacting protein [Thalictrum thalictroides]
MEPTDEVLEISSDEEDYVGSRGGDWLSYLLENEKEDSDEVVVLGEMSGMSVSQKQSNMLSPKEDLDDDDCLILDGDPDKPVEVENDADNGSDELLVVSEKGQIACRDYPHSRHLCARYPFSTNPHEKYCDLCHCYVCDTPAPCIYWGTGVSLGDHCHSTEKEETWRVQRKCFKQGIIAPLPVLKHPETTRSAVPNLSKPCPALACSLPPNNGYTPPVMLPKSSAIRACSSYSNIGAPSIISPRYHQQLAHTQTAHPLPNELTSGRNRLPHHGVSRPTSFSPSSSIIYNSTRNDKSTGGASLGPRLDSSHVKFKRCGGSILSNNRSGHGFDKNNLVHLPQLPRNRHTTVSLPEKNPHTAVSQPQRSHHRTLSQNGSHHRTALQTQRSHYTASSQPLSIHRTTVSQPQRSHYTTELQPHLSHQTTVSHPQTSHHTTSQSQSHHINQIYNDISDTRPVDSFVDINSEQMECQSASQPIPSSNYTDCPSYNMALQPQVHSQPIPLSNEKQNTYLPEFPAPIVTNQNVTNFEMDWVNDTVQGLAPSAENSQLPCMQSPSGPPPVTEANPQCPGDTDPASVDFDFWIQSLGHQQNLESVKDTMSSELGFIPSQDGLVDAAAMLLFDFESS